MLIDALHAALEHAVEAFDGVRARLAAHPLFPTVVDDLMVGERVAKADVVRPFSVCSVLNLSACFARIGLISLALARSTWNERGHRRAQTA